MSVSLSVAECRRLPATVRIFLPRLWILSPVVSAGTRCVRAGGVSERGCVSALCGQLCRRLWGRVAVSVIGGALGVKRAGAHVQIEPCGLRREKTLPSGGEPPGLPQPQAGALLPTPTHQAAWAGPCVSCLPPLQSGARERQELLRGRGGGWSHSRWVQAGPRGSTASPLNFPLGTALGSLWAGSAFRVSGRAWGSATGGHRGRSPGASTGAGPMAFWAVRFWGGRAHSIPPQCPGVFGPRRAGCCLGVSV